MTRERRARTKTGVDFRLRMSSHRNLLAWHKPFLSKRHKSSSYSRICYITVILLFGFSIQSQNKVFYRQLLHRTTFPWHRTWIRRLPKPRICERPRDAGPRIVCLTIPLLCSFLASLSLQSPCWNTVDLIWLTFQRICRINHWNRCHWLRIFYLLYSKG